MLAAFSRLHDLSLSAALAKAFWADEAARGVVSPLRFPLLAIWLLHPDERVLRVFEVLLVAANVGTFAAICRRAGGVGFASVAVAAVLLSIQLRKLHDPITDDALIVPLTAQCVLFEIAGFLAFFQGGQRRHFIAAVAGGLGAALLDPTGIAAAVTLAAASAIFVRGTARIVCVAAFAAVALTGALPTFATHGNFAVNAHSLLQQIAAVVPAEYRVLSGLVPDSVVAFAYDSRFDVIPNGGLLDWIFALCVAGAAGAGLYRAAYRNGKNSFVRDLGVVGLLLWLTAAAVSIPKAANILPWGDAFSGVYIESFGFALAVSALLWWMLQRQRSADRSLGSVVSIACGFCVFALLLGNVRFEKLVIARDQGPLTLRYVLSRAAAAGALDAVSPGSRILIPKKDLNRYGLSLGTGYAGANTFLYALSGRAYSVIGKSETADRAGYWLLQTRVTPALHEITLAQIRSYRDGIPMSSRGVSYVSAFSADFLKVQVVAQPIAQSGIQKNVRSIGPRSAVTFVSRTCGPVDARRVMLPDEPIVVFGRGFQHRFPSADMDVRLVGAVPLSGTDKNWRYGTQQATLVVRPGECKAKLLYLDADVYARAPGVLNVSYAGRKERLPVSQQVEHLHLALPGSQLSEVTFSTTSPALDTDMRVPRYEFKDPEPAYMLFVHPVATAEVN